jgi:hypothetical protein
MGALSLAEIQIIGGGRASAKFSVGDMIAFSLTAARLFVPFRKRNPLWSMGPKYWLWHGM